VSRSHGLVPPPADEASVSAGDSAAVFFGDVSAEVESRGDDELHAAHPSTATTEIIEALLIQRVRIRSTETRWRQVITRVV